jgi:flagellin-like protein
MIHTKKDNKLGPRISGVRKVVRPLGKKKGLSEVVSTLILLVVAVLLAGVVAYYATNVVMTRSETEDIQFTTAHIWVNDSGAIAAFKLQNLGGRDILIDKFTVRGVASDWADVFIYRVPSGTAITADLNITSYAGLVDGVSIDGKTYNVTSSDVPLMSGGELLVYIKDPDNIQMDDIGTTVSMAVFTNNAQYMTEENVESATTQ